MSAAPEAPPFDAPPMDAPPMDAPAIEAPDPSPASGPGSATKAAAAKPDFLSSIRAGGVGTLKKATERKVAARTLNLALPSPHSCQSLRSPHFRFVPGCVSVSAPAGAPGGGGLGGMSLQQTLKNSLDTYRKFVQVKTSPFA